MLPRIDRSDADHRVVLQAIMAHDGDRARERHRAHRLTGMATLLEILATYRLRRL